MKKVVNFVYYMMVATLSTLIVMLLLVGCDSGTGDDFEPPEFVYLTDVMPFSLPDGIEWITNITIANDSVYFAAFAEYDEDAPYHTFTIYSMDIDGSNIKELPNFTSVEEAEIPDTAEGGSVQVYRLFVDKDDNIWVVERGEFFYTPEGLDKDDWESWNQRVIVMEFSRVRKLDATGAELMSIDIGNIQKDRGDWFYVSALVVDELGNVFIGDDSSIHVLSGEGSLLFSLDADWVDTLIILNDGSVAHMGWGNKGRTLNKIDVSGKKFGETIDLPNNANYVHPGNDEYAFLYSDNIGLYGIEAESGESVFLLNWLDSDMESDNLENITFLEDGRILLSNQKWNSDGTAYELIFLTKTAYSDLPERINLTLAAFHLDRNIRSAVVQFNRESQTHRIHVTDYAEFNTDDDWQAGLTRLSAEIIAGNVPDILEISNLPYNQYVAKGLLIDLYPLIDSDPELNRSDFLESVLRSVEVNGGLYKIFPNFSVTTMLGNPEIIGDYPGWTMDEFVAILAANPNADFPLGQGLTKITLLQALFMFGMDSYVDWNEGKAYFDSNEFIALLEYANTLPDEFDWDNNYVQEPELISSGRQIVAATGFNSFHDYQMYRALFGGNIVFKGLPAGDRNGYSLMSYSSFAITSKCRDVDGAWAFLRTYLDEKWQKENSWLGIPVNKNVFEEMIKDAMKEGNAGSVGWDGFTIELEALKQEDVDKITNMINSVSSTVGQDDAIWNIISESAANYFNGQASIQDTVRIIQNRATTYISEQS